MYFEKLFYYGSSGMKQNESPYGILITCIYPNGPCLAKKFSQVVLQSALSQSNFRIIQSPVFF